ncbi:LysR substrate-binding domain-containing protein [Thioclava sp. 'Guangxiensis']|uniref:LysR family transcriptional regulator n=1 Tax=Thioclava sp. 'Guangxiensis' TaxID=3149044 RepID=UPI003877BE5B
MRDQRDLRYFIAAARHGGFRGAARATSTSASSISEAVIRLEERLGVRLFNRTTRSVALTQAGETLLARLVPALEEVDAALEATSALGKGPRGLLRLNVPGAVTRTILPPILERFLAAHPDITLELIANDGFVDVLASGADAGIRYEEALSQDMIAVPIGPRSQRFAAAAAPNYLERRGHPRHPHDLLSHDCIRTRFPGGALGIWEFEKAGGVVKIDPPARMTVSTQAVDMAISATVAGLGILMTFDGWLEPLLEDGRLLPVLEDWWSTFSGPFLYYPGRRHMPPPLRAFVDFVKAEQADERAEGRSRSQGIGPL